MLRYTLRRLALLVGIVFVISVGSFFLIHLLPGDPAVVILGFGASPSAKAQLYAFMGLDKPLIVQYLIWLGHVLHGNLGTSFISQVPVSTTIGAAWLIDLEMIVLSQFLAFITAIPLAMRSARRPDGWFDRFLGAGSFTLLAIPSYIIIVFLVIVVSEHLGVPNTGPSSYVPFTTNPWVNLSSMLLPAITLAAGSFVVYYRVLRSDLVATLQEEFITMARSKGISQRRIMWRHAFRPSSVALLGATSVNIGGLLAGGFVVQYLLAIPGLGYELIVQGLEKSDYLLIQGIVFTVSVAIVVISFVFDFIINLVDPRINRE